MAIKNIFVLKIIYKRLNKGIFRVFLVIFVYFSACSEKTNLKIKLVVLFYSVNNEHNSVENCK